MKKFEYLKRTNIKNVSELNEFGLLGWELINVFKIWEQNKNMEFIFKREIYDTK